MEQHESGARARLHRALRTMEGQHDRLHEIHREIDRHLGRGNGVEIEAWLRRLVSALEAHFELEEQVVFPVVVELDPAASGAVGELSAEHHTVLARIQAIIRSSEQTLRASLPEIRERLAAHEAAEERAVQRALGDAAQAS